MSPTSITQAAKRFVLIALASSDRGTSDPRILIAVLAVAPLAGLGSRMHSHAGWFVLGGCLAIVAAVGFVAAALGLERARMTAEAPVLEICESCRLMPAMSLVEFADGSIFDVCADCRAAAAQAQPSVGLRAVEGGAR